MSAPKRIQRKRTKGWRIPEDAIYVGRPTIYGNPFKVGIRVSVDTLNGEKFWDASAADVTAMFRGWLTAPAIYPGSVAARRARLRVALGRGDLRGKDLVCWCKLTEACHADVLLELANPTTPHGHLPALPWTTWTPSDGAS
jgi:hypothetical protein